MEIEKIVECPYCHRNWEETFNIESDNEDQEPD